MKALNSFALISLSSLAVAGAIQADEPIKTPPQQQQATIQAQTPQYQLVQSGRRQRWQLVTPSQNTLAQSPASTQQTVPAPAASSSPTTATSPAKITPVPQQQYVIQERRPGLLSRLKGKRYQYSSVVTTAPVTASTPSAASQPLPNAK